MRPESMALYRVQGRKSRFFTLRNCPKNKCRPALKARIDAPFFSILFLFLTAMSLQLNPGVLYGNPGRTER